MSRDNVVLIAMEASLKLTAACGWLSTRAFSDAPAQPCLEKAMQAIGLA